jgi:hypothetical protein
MILDRLAYRLWQTWLTVAAHPDADSLQAARAILTPPLWELFQAMQPGEQTHSLNIFRQIQALGETAPDLLIAALLHDSGKSLRPLSLWERAWIVVYPRFFPGADLRWSGLQPSQVYKLPFWQQPLAVSACHPAWGAQLAAERGASEIVKTLIAAHQDAHPAMKDTQVNHLLTVLQSVDDRN